MLKFSQGQEFSYGPFADTAKNYLDEYKDRAKQLSEEYSLFGPAKKKATEQAISKEKAEDDTIATEDEEAVPVKLAPTSEPTPKKRTYKKQRVDYYSKAGSFKDDISINIVPTYSRPMFFKEAEPAGLASNPQFEESFQRLAYEYVRNQAPGLMPYVVGFQCLQTNEDKTKAAACYGFKIGNEWLFAPVFFLNGNLKGHELLYIDSQKRFVPNDESWASVVIQGQSKMLGETAQEPLSNVNSRVADMMQLTRPPRHYKYSEFREKIANCNYLMGLTCVNLDKVAKFSEKTSELGKLLEKSAELCGMVSSMLAASPTLKAAYARLYGDNNILANALQQHIQYKTAASSKPLEFQMVSKQFSLTPDFSFKGTAQLKQPKIKVVLQTPDYQYQLRLYSENQRIDLATKGYTVLDKRQDDSVSTIIRQDTLNIQTPIVPGIYHVLTANGDTRRCVILDALVPGSKAETPSMVIDVETKEYIIAERKNILTVGGLDLNNCYRDYWNDLPEQDIYYCSERYSGEEELENVILSESGVATYPFSAPKDYRDDNVLRHVRWHHRYDSCCCCCSFGNSWYETQAPETISFDISPSNKFTETSRILYPPKNYKILHVNHPDKFTLGGLDVVRHLTTKTASAIEIKKSSGVYYVNQTPHTSKIAAIVDLCEKYNFRESDALDLLGSATSEGSIHHYCKAANDAPTGSDGSLTSRIGIIEPSVTAPNMYADPMVSGATMQEPMVDTRIVQGERAEDFNPDGRTGYPIVLPDPLEKQQIMEAANKGDTNVFDTHILKIMLKHCDESNLIHEAIPVLEKSLDKMGSLLFQYYWRHSTFEERFGKVDAPDYESNLISNFKSLGDLCIFLREKDVMPSNHLLFSSDLFDSAEQEP